MAEVRETMKLYVWRHCCFTDYTDGLAVALAENVEQARAVIAADMGYGATDLERAPEIFELDNPVGFGVYGGG